MFKVKDMSLMTSTCISSSLDVIQDKAMLEVHISGSSRTLFYSVKFCIFYGNKFTIEQMFNEKMYMFHFFLFHPLGPDIQPVNM